MGKKPAMEKRRDEVPSRGGNDAAFGYAPLPGNRRRDGRQQRRHPPGLAALSCGLRGNSRKRNWPSASPEPTAICAMPAYSTAPGGGARATGERSWPLSHIPVLIDGREWQALSAGLVQRADLL